MKLRDTLMSIKLTPSLLGVARFLALGRVAKGCGGNMGKHWQRHKVNFVDGQLVEAVTRVLPLDAKPLKACRLTTF